MLWNLFNCRDDENMQQALNNIPNSLADLYADVLVNKIPKGYAQKARLMLMWLSYALRPLTLKELACVASLPDPQDVLRICTSYLVSPLCDDVSPQPDGEPCNVEDSVVQFDHFSVKEYLTSDHLLATEDTAYFHASPHAAHLTIAEVLVSRIINTNHVDFTRNNERGATLLEESIKEDPLLTYSAAWYEHTVILISGIINTNHVDHIRNMDMGCTLVEDCTKEDHLLGRGTAWFLHTQQAITLGTSSLESKALPSKTRSAEAQPDLELFRRKAHKLFCSNEFSQSFLNWSYLVFNKGDSMRRKLTHTPRIKFGYFSFLELTIYGFSHSLTVD